MPSYISHAIMGEQLYNELDREGHIFQIPISKEEFKGYSLGADLAFLSTKITNDPQNYHTREFFINMLKYIKENKLIENSNVIALLYGHIAHYFLDINTHPLIYYTEQGCQRVGFIPNHDLVEGYISSYLSQKILGRKIMEIKPDYFNQIDLSNPNISKLLNSIYGQMYGDYNIIKSYKKVISLFSLLEDIIKSGLIPEKMLIQISQFNQFLHRNNLTTSELVNDSHSTYTNPVTGEKHNESLIDLYNKSIEMAYEAIKVVNDYLYSQSDTLNLEQVFTDLSYDTGVKCSLGKKYAYVRKKTMPKKIEIVKSKI